MAPAGTSLCRNGYLPLHYVGEANHSRTRREVTLASATFHRARQQFLDLDLDAVAADHHRAFGDREVGGHDPDLVVLRRIELDDGAAAEAQYLMDGHPGGTEHDG